MKPHLSQFRRMKCPNYDTASYIMFFRSLSRLAMVVLAFVIITEMVSEDQDKRSKSAKPDQGSKSAKNDPGSEQPSPAAEGTAEPDDGPADSSTAENEEESEEK